MVTAIKEGFLIPVLQYDYGVITQDGVACCGYGLASCLVNVASLITFTSLPPNIDIEARSVSQWRDRSHREKPVLCTDSIEGETCRWRLCYPLRVQWPGIHSRNATDPHATGDRLEDETERKGRGPLPVGLEASWKQRIGERCARTGRH